MNKKYELNAWWGKKYKLSIVRHTYAYDNSLAIELVDKGEPFAMLSVCIPEYPHTNENCIFVDTNNCSWAEEFIESNGLGKPTGMYAMSGFCCYPEYEMSDC